MTLADPAADDEPNNSTGDRYMRALPEAPVGSPIERRCIGTHQVAASFIEAATWHASRSSIAVGGESELEVHGPVEDDGLDGEFGLDAPW